MQFVSETLNSASPAAIMVFGFVLLCCSNLLRRRLPHGGQGQRGTGATASPRDCKVVSINRGRAPELVAPRKVSRAGNG